MHSYDIAIVGAGMVGLALAALIKQQQPDSNLTLIDPNPKTVNKNTTPNARVSAITLASQALLKQLSVWDAIPNKQIYTQTKVWHQGSLSALSFDAKETDNNHLGSIIANHLIEYALRQKTLQQGVNYHCAYLENLQEHSKGYKLDLSNGDCVDCGLLIGADGANSIVAKLAGIPNSQFDYAQKGIIALLAIHNKTLDFNQGIYQWFTEQGIIALLPISSKQCALVWSCDTVLADELLAKDGTDFAQHLSQACRYYFGELSLISKRQAFALKQKQARYYVKPKLALIGDAAHHIHPLAGQGVNLGFLDVLALADSLKQAKNKGKSLGNYRYLKRYEYNRKPANQLMSMAMSGFYEFNKIPDTSLINSLLGFSMNYVDKQTSLKQLLQKNASGLM